MRKIWTIAWKEIYTTFTDRSLLLIMIASPLALSTIVALAFGGFGGDDVPIADIPMALVNHDRGGSIGVNYGAIYVSLLTPAEGGETQSELRLPKCALFAGASEGNLEVEGVSLSGLTEAVVFDQALAESLVERGDVEAPHVAANDAAYLDAAAKAAVSSGVYTAAVIIPEDFSQRITYIPVLHPTLEQTGIMVYANSGSPIASGVVRSIVDGITNQIATGAITMAATLDEMQSTLGPSAWAQASTADFTSAFACAFDPASGTVHLDPETIEGSSERGATRQILVWVGSAQAMFFALFTAQFGVLGIHNERRQGTLQRLVVSPTPRSSILAGYLVGVFMTVVFQIVILMLALMLIGSLLQGKLDLIWGQNLALISGLLFSVALAVSGFGMLMAGIVRSPEQGQMVGPIANMAMGVLGGAFGFVLPKAVSIFSIVFWGREAFQKLAAGQADIGLNLAILVVQGAVMYGLGVMMFNRRFEFA